MIFTKVKWQTQVAVIIFNSLMSVSVALQSNWIMIGIHGLAIVRDIVFILQDKFYPNNRKLSYSVITLFMTASIIVGVFTFGWWFDVLLIMASMFVDFGSWAKGIHLIRISRLTFASLAIVNFIVFFNPIAIGIQAFAITAVIIFYIKLYIARRKNL